MCVHTCPPTERLVKKALPLLRPWDEFSDREGRKIDAAKKKITLKLSYSAYPRGLGQMPGTDINDLWEVG